MIFDPKKAPLSKYRRAGNILFLSGQIAFDHYGQLVGTDIAEQTRQVFRNISEVLKECRCTLNDVVNATVWLREESDFAEFNSVYAEHFQGILPARSTVVSGLLANALVEIAVVAYLPMDDGEPTPSLA